MRDITAEKNVILLTGPNMSGKSTLLKAISLSVYLGHAGFAVPASKAVMPFFSTISVAINLTDSIVSGYSHFMSEIVTLKNVLREACDDKRCFAVFDELFRGTNIEDALEIRRRVLLAFELAERQAAAGGSAEPLNFVVVGGGPTGVELAGTLAEICRHSLAGDFRSIAPERTHIQLIEGGPRVLPAYSEDLSQSALEQLRRVALQFAHRVPQPLLRFAERAAVFQQELD